MENQEKSIKKLDDLLYDKLINLLQQVKLVQGNTALNSTLRRHYAIKKFLIQKQVDKITALELDLSNLN